MEGVWSGKYACGGRGGEGRGRDSNGTDGQECKGVVGYTSMEHMMVHCLAGIYNITRLSVLYTILHIISTAM